MEDIYLRFLPGILTGAGSCRERSRYTRNFFWCIRSCSACLYLQADQGNWSGAGGQSCGHRWGTGFWNDGILLSALLSAGMHIHDHGGYLPEHTFPVWAKWLGGIAETGADRHVWCVWAVAEKLPEYGGNFRICKWYFAAWRFCCVSGGTDYPAWSSRAGGETAGCNSAFRRDGTHDPEVAARWIWNDCGDLSWGKRGSRAGGTVEILYGDCGL